MALQGERLAVLVWTSIGAGSGLTAPGAPVTLAWLSRGDAGGVGSRWWSERLGMVFDHEAEVEDMGMSFQAVVSAITAEQWRSGAPAGDQIDVRRPGPFGR